MNVVCSSDINLSSKPLKIPFLSHLGTLLSQTERERGHQRTSPRVEMRRRERRRTAKERMRRGRSLKQRGKSQTRRTVHQALTMKRHVSSLHKYLHSLNLSVWHTRQRYHVEQDDAFMYTILFFFNLRKTKAERNTKTQKWTKMCGGGKWMN